MKHLIYITVIIFVVTSIGCRKDKEEKTYLISGRILKDCSMESLANTPLRAHVNVLNCVKLGKCLDVYYFDTDNNGNFSFVMQSKGTIDIRNSNGMTTYLMAPAPSGKELHLGSFIARPTTSFVYRIKANNPYSAGDTLVTNLQGAGGGQFKFAAPLKDTSFTISNYTGILPLNYENIGLNVVEIGYGIYKNSINVASNWYINIPRVQYKIQSCHHGNQEVVLEIN